MTASASPGGRFAAALLAALVAALLFLLFVAIYVTAPNPFTALWEMGVLALVLGLVSYLAQALSRDPIVQRALGWGLGAAGFALLLGDIWAGPNNPLNAVGQLVLSIVVLLFLVVTVALAWWRTTSVARTEVRVNRRTQWDHSSPPSAFDYAAAHTPGTTPGGSPGTEAPATPAQR